MKNNEINYDTSTDYELLLSLLKKGVDVVAFVGIEIDSVVSLEHNKLVYMQKKINWIDLGFAHISSIDFHKMDFERMCKKHNVRFIIPQNTAKDE